ncbi:VOC family protein [Actinomadura geliboluensis]|uniref:VOC family protein n=1 Tax=Actinomadura geliboluensis TaxID=882440 RepID=UPI00372373FA
MDELRPCSRNLVQPGQHWPDAKVGGLGALAPMSSGNRGGEEFLWQVGENAWVVVEERDVRAERVGTAMVTLGVDDLDETLARLAAHGIGHEPVETYGNGVRHVVVLDPDGNSLSLAEAPAQSRQ